MTKKCPSIVARFKDVTSSYAWRSVTRLSSEDGPDWLHILTSWVADGTKAMKPYFVTEYPDREGDWAAFTQMIWATTAYVGCGYSKDFDGVSSRMIYVCYYAPG